MACINCENVPACVWFEGGNRRNVYIAMLSGILFTIGWWFYIDVISVNPGSVHPAYIMCGIAGTLSLVLVNSISNTQVRGDSYEGGCLGGSGAKVLLFFGFVIAFASVIASCGMLLHSKTKDKYGQWPAAAVILQNIFICLASLSYKFLRIDDVWG